MFRGRENHDQSQNFANKQPLKWVQIPIHKFSEVAVPHHVDLLKRHKGNIEKFHAQGDWDRVHREQINATRLVKQLKSLLCDMDILRNQVIETDLEKFDKLISSPCQSASNAIKEYLDLNPQRQIMPMWNDRTPRSFSDSSYMESSSRNLVSEELQTQIDTSINDLSKQEECLKSWELLQTEVQDIHQLFEEFAQLVHEQQESIDQIESTVETTAENVSVGASHIRSIKTTIYPLAGAVLGGCMGGPVGLMAGLKLGGLAALGCGLIGFTGGKFLKKKKDEELDQFNEQLNDGKSDIKKESLSTLHCGKED